MSSKKLKLSVAATLSSLFFIVFAAKAQTGAQACGELANAYGPYDARRDLDKLPIVLGAHFTPDVESLRKGLSSYLGADISYTLRAIPNYPRALLSMIRLGERDKTDKPAHSLYTVECWLDRAIRFSPDDYVVRMIYAGFLGSKQRKPEALQQLDLAKSYAGDNPFTYYNLGLVYTDLGEYELALEQAYIAYDLGVQKNDLRDRLKAVGKWREPGSANTEVNKDHTEIPASAK